MSKHGLKKKCSKCHKILDVINFHRNKKRKDGLSYWCKKCHKKYRRENKEKIRKAQKKYRDTHKQKIKEYLKKNKERIEKKRKEYYKKHCKKLRKNSIVYRRNNKEKLKVIHHNYYKTNENKVKDYYLQKKYGITLDDYNKILKKQKGKCWICEAFPKTRRLSVDHSHKTGQVRGLLCHRCNRGLAWFSDNPKLLNRAAKYLMKGR